jgi:hypothetical protein
MALLSPLGELVGVGAILLRRFPVVATDGGSQGLWCRSLDLTELLVPLPGSCLHFGTLNS